MSLRERIVEETTSMFVTYGIKSIRMDDIAAKLGISKRTIYEIFGDKETLITECLLHYGDEVERKKKAQLSRAGNIIEEFLILLEDWETDMETNYKLMTNVRKFYPKIYEKISAARTGHGYAMFKEKLETGVREGYLLSDINYDLAIAVFSYSILGIVSQNNLVLPRNVSEIDAFRYVITYFIRGVATEKGIKLIDGYIEKIKKKAKTKHVK